MKSYGKIRYKYEWKDFDDWFRKFGPKKDPEAYTDFTTVLYYLEGLGVFVQRGLIDIGLVADLMSNRVIVLWEKLEHAIKGSRIKQKAPKYHDHFEYLYNELKRRESEI